jgi:hypothetical protein
VKHQAAKLSSATVGVDWRSGGSAVDTRESGLSPIEQRLEIGGDGSAGAQAVQSSDSLAVDMPVGRAAALSVPSPQVEPALGQETFAPDATNNTFNSQFQKVPQPLFEYSVTLASVLFGSAPQWHMFAVKMQSV